MDIRGRRLSPGQRHHDSVSSADRQLTFLDLLNVASFLIGIQNLEANLDQNDKQDLQHDLTENAERLLAEIHGHLEQQDRKIDEILRSMKERHT